MTRQTHPVASAPPRKTLGRAGWAVMGCAILVLFAGVAGAFWFSGAADKGSSIGGPFALVDGDGKTVTDRDFRGRYMLVFFGYTFCPDVCPTTMNEIAEALDALGPRADRVAPVFISVDPQRDTPAAIKQFAQAFSPRLIGLTGDPAAITRVARDYRVYYVTHRPTGSSSGLTDYTIDHSSLLYLMGPDGRFIAPIRGDTSGKQMATDIARHLS